VSVLEYKKTIGRPVEFRDFSEFVSAASEILRILTDREIKANEVDTVFSLVKEMIGNRVISDLRGN
jgi:hypothetical protein